MLLIIFGTIRDNNREIIIFYCTIVGVNNRVDF